jgi:predicted amidohydrolase YtcJ
MQMARTSANQQMNSRGLFNSSLAVTASDQAAYAAALPIAQADASVYDTNAKQNLAYQNEALKTNTAGINDMTGKNLSATVDAMKSNMDAAMKTQLATIEADYKTTMQNSATASEMYKQTVKNISDIQANKDMTLAAKQAAVDNQFYLMKQGFEIAGAIGNMNLGELLNFSAAPAVV